MIADESLLEESEARRAKARAAIELLVTDCEAVFQSPADVAAFIVRHPNSIRSAIDQAEDPDLTELRKANERSKVYFAHMAAVRRVQAISAPTWERAEKLREETGCLYVILREDGSMEPSFPPTLETKEAKPATKAQQKSAARIEAAIAKRKGKRAGRLVSEEKRRKAGEAKITREVREFVRDLHGVRVTNCPAHPGEVEPCQMCSSYIAAGL